MFAMHFFVCLNGTFMVKGLFEHKDVCHFIIYEIEPCGIFFTEGTKVK